LSENPVLAAMEVYRRTHPHRSDELDEAFARSDPDSGVASVPAAGESDPAATSEQLSIDDDLEAIFPVSEYPDDHVGPNPELTIREAFLRFHRENPHVYAQLQAMAQEAQRAGATKIGIGMMFEVLRWQTLLRTRGDDFKLNNNYRSYYARLLIARNPALSELFELRRLHGRGLSGEDVQDAA